MTWYTMVADDGRVLRAQYTQNANAAVLGGARLLPDNPPQFDGATHELTRVDPVPNDAEEIEYLLTPAVFIVSNEVGDEE